MAKKSLGVFFVLLVVLLAAQELVVERAEAKTCDVLSDKFGGPCFSSVACDDVCVNQEELISGVCKGNYNCYCRKNC